MSQAFVDRRSVIAAVAGFGAGAVAGVAAASMADAFALPAGQGQLPPPKVAQGKVLADPPPSGTEVSVQIGSAVQRVPYQVPYVPVAGDTVDVIFLETGQGQSPMILGARSGQAGNLVVNGDMRAIPPLLSKKPPAMWAQHRTSGRNVAVLAMIAPRLQRPAMVMASYPDLSGDHTAYSAAFPVQAGETIHGDAAAYLEMNGPAQLQIDLIVAWQAELETPFAKGQQKVLYSRTPTAGGDYSFEGGAAVPAGVKAARVGVRVRHEGGEGSQYTLYVGHVYAQR